MKRASTVNERADIEKYLSAEFTNEIVEGPFVTGERLGFTLAEVAELIDFEESQDSFAVPPIARQTALVSPLFDWDTEGVFKPHLIDAIADALTEDAWEWQTRPIDGGNKLDEIEIDFKDTSEIEKKLTQDARGCVIWNIFETERNYTRQLYTIQKTYHKRMVERKLVSEHSASLIFFGISELLAVHAEIYLNLERLLINWDTGETRLGKLFVDSMEDLKRSYTLFIDNYSVSQKILQKEEKSNDKLVAFFREISPEDSRQSVTLKEYLTYPVQRSTRYHILFQDLLKRTSEDHVDYDDLKSAWQAMAELARVVNDVKRKEEEMTGIFESYQETKNCPVVFISHKRRLILATAATCPSSNKNVKLVICSDLLMITIALPKHTLLLKGDSHTHRFVRWLDLLDIEFAEHPDIPDAVKISTVGNTDPNRKSLNTRQQDIYQAVRELTWSTLIFQFTGYDATKKKNIFLQTIEIVQKSCLAAYNNAAADPS